MTRLLVAAALLAAGCSGTPPAPLWRANALAALQAFEQRYLAGDGGAAEKEFARARAEIGASGRLDLLARAELIRCAARVASLEFDDCPGYRALEADATATEAAYAAYLAGRGPRPSGAGADADAPLSRLVAAGVQMRAGTIAPAAIAAAVTEASAQGWRRPLLAWLGVQLQRAEAAGDRAAAEQVRRRIDLASRP